MVAAGLRAACVVLCAAVCGCFYFPSPLAPGVRGSVGVPHRGVLSDGTALPRRGPGYRLLRHGDVRWGHARLVSAIESASADVARRRPGSAPLVVGDLSGRHGGRIPRHRSHRTGRDVDFLFYVVTPDGRSIENPGFVHFGPDGLAKTATRTTPFVRLDVPRQWLLVRALLTSSTTHVQWLFVARWLEALLIEYATALGEDPELIWRAENVLRQPSDSASHDDHIHMRLACTPADAIAGCVHTGPRWPWLPRPTRALSPSDDELLQALLDD